jgi:hypothetical protein
MLSVIIPSVVMLSVVLLNVVMLSVAALSLFAHTHTSTRDRRYKTFFLRRRRSRQSKLCSSLKSISASPYTFGARQEPARVEHLPVRDTTRVGLEPNVRLGCKYTLAYFPRMRMTKKGFCNFGPRKVCEPPREKRKIRM